MSTAHTQLIRELARLASKYEPEDFAEVARLLREGDLLSTLAAAIDELSSASARRRTGNRASKGVVAQIRALERSDPRRAALIADLRSRLLAGELLPSMTSLRAFSEAVGMKELHASRREQAVAHVLTHLITLPEHALESALGAASAQPDRRLGEEYERWVALILDQEPATAVRPDTHGPHGAVVP